MIDFLTWFFKLTIAEFNVFTYIFVFRMISHSSNNCREYKV